MDFSVSHSASVSNSISILVEEFVLVRRCGKFAVAEMVLPDLVLAKLSDPSAPQSRTVGVPVEVCSMAAKNMHFKDAQVIRCLIFGRTFKINFPAILKQCRFWTFLLACESNRNLLLKSAEYMQFSQLSFSY